MQQSNSYYNPAGEIDEELTIDFKKIFVIVWRRKFLMLKIFSSVILFFILSTFICPKNYQVDADLYINKTNNSNMMEINPYFISEIGAGTGMASLMTGGGNLTNELEIIQSPLVIDKVIRENDLRFKKLFGFITTRKTGQYLTTEKFLKKQISFEIKKGTNIVTISFKDKDKELAYNVVSSIIKNYIQLHKEINTEKSKSDKLILEAEYNSVKEELNKKMNAVKGMPSSSMSGSGGLTALSVFSKSARKAISGIQSEYVSGVKSEIALQEEAEKVAELAKKLEWAKLVENMSDSSNVIVLKEPKHLKDYEQVSPKLFMNIVFGIIFGAISALGMVIFKENTDKNLSYSMLGEEIIYNIEKDFIDLKAILISQKRENVSFITFENINEPILSELNKFNNLNFVKAGISEEFEHGTDNSDKIILAAKIGQTDARLYKKIKNLLVKMNKRIIAEVLV